MYVNMYIYIHSIYNWGIVWRLHNNEPSPKSQEMAGFTTLIDAWVRVLPPLEVAMKAVVIPSALEIAGRCWAHGWHAKCWVFDMCNNIAPLTAQMW